MRRPFAHKLSAALALTTAVFGLSACRSWEPIETIASLAFADDDSAIAMMVFRFESKPNNNPLMGTTLKRNMRHQLYVESPRHFDVVPSPDGDHIAVLMAAPGCPSMSGPASPTGGYGATEPITVTFLDAATLNELQSQTLTVSTMNLEWTWRPAGDFVVSSGDKSWSLDVGRAPNNTTKPRCFWPKTASSQWSSSGTFIESDNLRVVVSGQNASAAFGCQ